VVRKGQDKATVVSFDMTAELVADLTDDADKLAMAIRGLRPGGGTALYDAVFFSCRDKLMLDQPRHKVPARDDHLERRRRQREPLDPRAGARDGPQGGRGDLHHLHQHHAHRIGRRQGAEALSRRRLAGCVFPFKAQDLTQSFENIANELRHQYNVLYRPSRSRPTVCITRSIIKVKGRKELVVRRAPRLLRPLALTP
jgi:hypothetical protein